MPPKGYKFTPPRMTLRERGVLSASNPYNIRELNKGAKHYGFTGWFDPRLSKHQDAQNILNQLSKFEGIWRTPLTLTERVTIASQAQVKHTWASLTKEFPDFEKGMKDYLDNKTTKTELIKINKLKISSEKKFNMMTGKQKKFLMRHNKEQFQPFKDTITTKDIRRLSNFKEMASILGPVNKNSFNYKNGIRLLDRKFNRAHRATAFQDYLKKEGVEKVEISSEGAEGQRFQRRYRLTPAAIKAGKTFEKILKAYPNLNSNPSEIYNDILAKATRNNPIYIETQGGLRSVFNFVKDSINSDLENYKPKFLRSMVENNPAMLRHATAYVDPASRTIKYQGVGGLKNLSDTELLERIWINTEHNRPMRDYASKFMDAGRKTIKPHMLKFIDVDMVHNISPAPFWYNNSLKETATRLAESNPDNPKLLNHLDKEFKLLKQRFYAGDKFYGAQIETSPSYGKSIMSAWRNNYKGMGLEKSFDKYAAQYSNRGFGTIANVLDGVKKDPKAIKQLGQFFGCITFNEGGRVNLAAGGQGVAQCVETKLKQPGAMEKVAQLPKEVGGALGKLKNVTRGFLGILGRAGTKAAPLAALAVAGAAIEPLVKQFVADDPSTYLTNENQMKGMLLATIEGEKPKVDEEILKWQMPALGAATAAGAIPGAGETYKARRGLPPTKSFVGPMEKGVGPVRSALGIKGVLGKALGATFSPLAVAATLPLDIAAQKSGGTELGDIATDPLNWMGPAFMSSGYEMASKGIKNPILLKALRMGMSPRTLSMVSRRFGLPGLAISAGMWGYDKWKNRSINDDE